jgi:hypothetical protein
MGQHGQSIVPSDDRDHLLNSKLGDQSFPITALICSQAQLGKQVGYVGTISILGKDGHQVYTRLYGDFYTRKDCQRGTYRSSFDVIHPGGGVVVGYGDGTHARRNCLLDNRIGRNIWLDKAVRGGRVNM